MSAERSAEIGRQRAERHALEARVAHVDVTGDRERAGRAAGDERGVDDAADRRKADDVHARQNRRAIGHADQVMVGDGPAGAERARAIESQTAGQHRTVVAREQKRSELAVAVFVDCQEAGARTVRAVGVDRAARTKTGLPVSADDRVAADRFAGRNRLRVRQIGRRSRNVRRRLRARRRPVDRTSPSSAARQRAEAGVESGERDQPAA